MYPLRHPCVYTGKGVSLGRGTEKCFNPTPVIRWYQWKRFRDRDGICCHLKRLLCLYPSLFCMGFCYLLVINRSVCRSGVSWSLKERQLLFILNFSLRCVLYHTTGPDLWPCHFLGITFFDHFTLISDVKSINTVWLNLKNQNCLRVTSPLYSCNPIWPTPQKSLRSTILMLKRHLCLYKVLFFK